MAAHSSILAWRFPWTKEPFKLQSTGSVRIRYACVNTQQQQQQSCLQGLHLFLRGGHLAEGRLSELG